jgi:hypothetical protein
MGTITGIVRDTQENPVPGANVSLVYKKALVGYNGGVAVQNKRQFVADANGLVSMANLVPGDYDFYVSIVANDNTTLTILQAGTMRVLEQATQTWENAITETVGTITPTVLQQAIDAKDAAEAAEAALATVAYERAQLFSGVQGQSDYSIITPVTRADEVQLYRNGQKLRPTSDYTVPEPGVLRLDPAIDVRSDDRFQYLTTTRSTLPPDTPFTFDTWAELEAEIAENGAMAGRYYIAAGLVFFAPVGGSSEIPALPGLVPSGDPTFRHYGAVGDNATDDTATCQAALTANPNRHVNGEFRKYRIDGTLVGHKVKAARFRKTGTGSLIRAWGDSGTEFAPDTQFATGARVIVCADAAALLSVGDWFAVKSTENPYANMSGNSGGQSGELVQVVAIDGANITINSPLLWAYGTLAGNTQRVVVFDWLSGVDFDTVDIEMAGNTASDPGTGLFNDDAQGIDARFVLHPTYRFVHVHNGRQAGVLSHVSVNARYIGCNFYDLASDPVGETGVGLGYGVHERGMNIGATVSGCNSNNVRSLYTTGAGLSSIWQFGVPVGTTVSGCSMVNHKGTAASTHEAGAFINITGNTAVGCRIGANVRAKWCTVSNNTFSLIEGRAVVVVNDGVDSVAEGAVVKGNTIFRSNLTLDTSQGAIDDNSPDGTIEWNTIKECGGPAIQVNSTLQTKIKGNIIENPCQISFEADTPVRYAIGGTNTTISDRWWIVDQNTIIVTDDKCTIGVNKPDGYLVKGSGNTTLGLVQDYSGESTNAQIEFTTRVNFGGLNEDQFLTDAGVLVLGAASVTNSIIVVRAPSGESSDTMTGISGGVSGDMIFLRARFGQTITVNNGSGADTIRTGTGSSFDMTYTSGAESLYGFVKTGTFWVRVS